MRRPEGQTKANILRSLEQGKKRFSDLKKELSLSKPMLAEHLKDLKKEDKIRSERVGREVFYDLTIKQWNKPETKIHLFSSSYLSFTNQDVAGRKTDEERLWKLSDEEFGKELLQKLGMLVLFTIIKSHETNEKWYEAATSYIEQLAQGGTIFRRLAYPKPGLLPRSELIHNQEFRVKVSHLYEAMRKLYPREMKVMEQIYRDPKVLLDPDSGEKLFEYASPPQKVEVSKSSIEKAKLLHEKLGKKT